MNLGKSSFIVINPKRPGERSNIILENGFLKCARNFVYLGVIISDNGSIKDDVKRYLDMKRSNVCIKFSNFCKINRNAPLHVKLDVLEKCVSSSLLYGSETWGNNTQDIEFIYRSGIKTALGVRQNVNNEIIYIECNKFPLECEIRKRQLKFWIKINDYIVLHPDSSLNKIIHIGVEANLNFLKYYKTLSSTYSNPESCQISLQEKYKISWKNKIISAFENDNNSKLGTYYRINPDLKSFIPKSQTILEIERILITRYRTGSHSLSIELGRYSNIPRLERLCCCGNDIQTIWHIFSECPLTLSLVDRSYQNLQAIFLDENVHKHLLLITKKLNIPIGKI